MSLEFTENEQEIMKTIDIPSPPAPISDEAGYTWKRQEETKKRIRTNLAKFQSEEIESQRLFLIEISPEHFQTHERNKSWLINCAYQFLSDPVIMRYYGSQTTDTLEQVTGNIEQWFEYYQVGQSVRYLIIRKDLIVIGIFGFVFPKDDNDAERYRPTCEIHPFILIHPDFMNQSYAIETLLAVWKKCIDTQLLKFMDYHHRQTCDDLPSSSSSLSSSMSRDLSCDLKDVCPHNPRNYKLGMTIHAQNSSAHALKTKFEKYTKFTFDYITEKAVKFSDQSPRQFFRCNVQLQRLLVTQSHKKEAMNVLTKQLKVILEKKELFFSMLNIVTITPRIERMMKKLIIERIPKKKSL